MIEVIGEDLTNHDGIEKDKKTKKTSKKQKDEDIVLDFGSPMAVQSQSTDGLIAPVVAIQRESNDGLIASCTMNGNMGLAEPTLGSPLGREVETNQDGWRKRWKGTLLLGTSRGSPPIQTLR